MTPPDWRTLRIFLEALECGSVTRAAERCGIAVSAAAKRIQDLETELGVRLLERAARGVTATSAGELVAQHARSLFDFNARLHEDLYALAGGGLGSVRLNATLSAIAGHPLAQALAEFAIERSRISVELRELTSLAILQNIVEGRADVGIITIGGTVPQGLEARLWRLDRLMVVTPADHELAKRQTLAFAEVIRHPLIGVVEGGALAALLEEAAERLGHRLHYSFRVSTVEAAIRLIAAGHGITIMPDGMLNIYNPNLQLSGVPLAEPWAQRQLRIVSRPAAMLPVPARLLIDHLSAFATPESSPPTVRK